MRKHFLKIALAAFVSFALSACQKGTPTPEPTLSIAPSDETVVFTAEGGTKSIEITTNQKSWDVLLTPTDGHGWLSFEQEGKTLRFTATENTALREQDPVTVTIRAGSAAPVTLSARQEAMSPDPSLTTDCAGELMFESIAHALSVRVQTNQPTWEVAIEPADGAGWLTLEKEEESFTVHATANPKPVERGPVTITVTAGEAEPVVLLAKQEAAAPVLSTDPSGKITFLADGGRNTVRVTTNFDGWEVALTPADGNGWLTMSEQADSFTLTAAKNTLTTAPAPVTVTVTAGEATPVTITALQDAADAPVVYYKVGDYYPDEANAEGIVWYIDPGSSNDGAITGLHGKIVALDTPDIRVQWAGPNMYSMANLSREDGAGNTAAILAYAEEHGYTLDPLGAFMRCVNRGEGWYLPAFNEHRRLFTVMSGTTFEEMTDPARKNPAYDPSDPTQEGIVPEYLPVWTDYSAMPDKTYVLEEGEWKAVADPKYKAARDAFNAKFTAKGGQALYNGFMYWWSSTSADANQSSWAFGNPTGSGQTQYRGSSPGAYVRAMKTF